MNTQLPTTLEAYALGTGPQKALARFDDLCRTMRMLGRPVPELVRLFPADYDAIDASLKRLTGGQLNITGVTYRSRKLVRQGE